MSNTLDNWPCGSRAIKTAGDGNHAGTGVLSITNGGLITSSGTTYIGYSGGIGTATISGGTLLTIGPLYLGSNISNSAPGIGAVRVSGGGSVSTSGTGIVNLSGGTLSVGSLDVSGNLADLNWTGGTLSVTGTSGLAIGPSGLSTSLALSTGQTLAVTNQLTISSGGILSVTSGTLLAGIVSQTGGVATFSNGLSVDAGQIGNYLLSSGTLSVGSFAYVGINGAGTFNQGGGTISLNSTPLYIGYNAGSSGNYLLSNNVSLASTSSVLIGWSGAGTFNQSGGTASVFTLGLGENAGSSGTYFLNNGGTLSAVVSEFVGYAGAGTFVQNGGVNSVLSGLSLGYTTGSGTYLLSNNGSLTVQSVEYVGNGGTGTFVETSGTNTVGTASRTYYLALGTGVRSYGNYALSGTGSLTVNGSVYLGGSNFGSGGTGILSISGAGAAAAVSGTVKVYPSGTLTIANGASLSAGTIDLSTAGQFNFSAGQVTINNGSLILPSGGATIGDGSAFANLQLHNSTINSGSLGIAAKSSLTGSGTLMTAVSVAPGGTLWPTDGVSNGIGRLTSSANLTLNTSGFAHSTLEMEIGATTTPGSTFDQIVMTGGTFTVGGATLQLIALSGLTLNAKYAIVTTAGGTINTSTMFSNLTNGTAYNDGTVQYTVSYSSSEIDVTFTATPEPASILMALGGAGIMLLRRQRRSGVA